MKSTSVQVDVFSGSKCGGIWGGGGSVICCGLCFCVDVVAVAAVAGVAFC